LGPAAVDRNGRSPPALINGMSRVTQILVAETPSSPMTPLREVRAVPGKGLEGDRYFSGTGTFSPKPQKPDFEITLIEGEKIEAFARESGLPFNSLLARRNIVTEGVALNDLVGEEFRVGEVRMRGIRLCEPCNHLAKASFPEILKGLVHKAGLRAQIISEGRIQVGNQIRKEQ
jgi:MOSC domain-containing protein YiiM